MWIFFFFFDFTPRSVLETSCRHYMSWQSFSYVIMRKQDWHTYLLETGYAEDISSLLLPCGFEQQKRSGIPHGLVYHCRLTASSSRWKEPGRKMGLHRSAHAPQEGEDMYSAERSHSLLFSPMALFTKTSSLWVWWQSLTQVVCRNSANAQPGPPHHCWLSATATPLALVSSALSRTRKGQQS